MITKVAMDSTDVSIESKIQDFDELVGTSSLSGTVMTRYLNQALSLIKEKKNFEVLSYHSRDGFFKAIASSWMKILSGYRM